MRVRRVDGLAPPDYPQELLPEVELWIAVLSAGIKDARGEVPYWVRKNLRKQLQCDAQDWVRERGERPAGFDWVCHLMNLNPERVRDALEIN